VSLLNFHERHYVPFLFLNGGALCFKKGVSLLDITTSNEAPDGVGGFLGTRIC
jgi:hypothetical protein